MKEKFYKYFYSGATILGIILVVLMTYYGFKLKIFTDEDKLNALLLRTGNWGIVIFLLMQILQTVIAIIPGAFTCIVGVAVYGYFWGSILNFIGVMMGCIIVFYLVRKFGKKYINMVVKEEDFNKYKDFFKKNNRREKLFALSQLSPVGPADLICMLVALTDMTFENYLLILSLTKPISLTVYSIASLKLIEAGFSLI